MPERNAGYVPERNAGYVPERGRGSACDAGGVTTHRITYEGPASLAVNAATLLADTQGIELTSAGQPEPGDGPAGTVLLALTVEGTPEAVAAAVGRMREALPAGASVRVEEGPASEGDG